MPKAAALLPAIKHYVDQEGEAWKNLSVTERVSIYDEKVFKNPHLPVIDRSLGALVPLSRYRRTTREIIIAEMKKRGKI